MRPRRACIPLQDREDYIASLGRRGVGEIAVRQQNRYIDEFVRWRSDSRPVRSAKDVTLNDVKAFAEAVNRQPLVGGTRLTKVRCVVSWVRWYYESQSKDPPVWLAELQVCDLIERSRVPKRQGGRW